MACRTQERRAVAATDRETKDRAGMDGEGLGAVDMVLYHRSGAGISTIQAFSFGTIFEALRGGVPVLELRAL